MLFNLDPTIFTLGPLSVRWYGLMYVLGFIWAGFIGKKLIKQGYFPLPIKYFDSLFSYALVGIVLGARVLFVLVYNPDYYFSHPWEIFAIWKGGLSFHGAFLGLMIALYFFARKVKLSVLVVWDSCVLMGALGIFFGRLGNFINGELWGRVTELPWGVIFPNAGGQARHPSQIYEALTEGLLVFAFLWLLKPRVKKAGVLASWYPISYGVARFFTEFFREPDPQLGYYLGFFSMGQILCVLLVLLGIGVQVHAAKRQLPFNFAN
jgi:phosphatidylglycerol:prolipoprotein diacylglycerol transferase